MRRCVRCPGYCHPNTAPLPVRNGSIDGTVPTQPDDWHQMFDIDRRNGQLATASTPPEYRTQQTFIILPPIARDWGIRNGIEPAPDHDLTTAAPANVGFRSPDAYTVYEISPVLPPESQRLRLLASVPQNTRQVDYLLNGESIHTVAEPPFDAWWQLVIGRIRIICQCYPARWYDSNGSANSLLGGSTPNNLWLQSSCGKLTCELIQK